MKIDIDETIVPQGWEAIAFRKPKDGESYLDLECDVIEGESSSFNRIVVRRKFDLEALKQKLRTVYSPGTWFAMDRNGDWFSFYEDMETDEETGEWDDENGSDPASQLSVEWPPGDWKDSKFQI